MTNYKQIYINGQWVGSSTAIENINPSDTSDVVGRYAKGSSEDCLAAIEAANVSIQNLPPWVILLLILGWVLPSPMEIYRGTVNAITGSISYIFGGIKELVNLIRGK